MGDGEGLTVLSTFVRCSYRSEWFRVGAFELVNSAALA